MDANCDLGMVGTGVMGRNLVYNMVDHGFSIIGYLRNPAKIQPFLDGGQGKTVYAVSDYKEFVRSLRRPRAVMLLVTAGSAVDKVISDLTPLLDPDDIIIDGGNSFFKDTDRRGIDLAAKEIHFLGTGISGGESGARHGPSIMPGGPQKAYEVVRPILEAVAAKVGDQPCVTYIGPGSAGHYVKMVHNGIEYGLMQLISESYNLMKRGLRLSNDELADVYETWNKAELNSFLLEITVDIFRKEDDKGAGRLIDIIRGAARQKGTGMWTSQNALELGVPIPTIDVAVAMRSMSDYQREVASELLTGPKTEYIGDKKQFIAKLRNSLYIGVVTTYAQGMDLLRVASSSYAYNLDLVDIASIWRGGCIIRSALLHDIRIAFQNKNDLSNLILDAQLSKLLSQKEADLRTVVATATQLGIPVPGLMMSLAYYDTWRSSWLPANLIQAQRDYFGAHTYQRLDMDGVFHTEWETE